MLLWLEIRYHFSLANDFGACHPQEWIQMSDFASAFSVLEGSGTSRLEGEGEALAALE